MSAESRVPIERAAQELGTTVLAVLMQIKRQRLEGVEIEGAWYVSAGSLEAFRPDEEGAAGTCRGHCAGHGGCSGSR